MTDAIEQAERILNDPQVTLNALRLQPGDAWLNYFGENVYLRQTEGCITDCCLVEDPCRDHGGSWRVGDGTRHKIPAASLPCPGCGVEYLYDETPQEPCYKCEGDER